MEIERILTNFANSTVRLLSEADNVRKVMPGMGEIAVAHSYLEAVLAATRLAQEKVTLFITKNSRRQGLIQKRYAGEEDREENLSAEERKELQDLQDWTEAFLSSILAKPRQ